MRALGLILVLAATVPAADADRSKRPVARAGTDARNLSVPAVGAPVTLAAAVSPASLRPKLRPGAIVERAMARRNDRRKGGLCGDADLQGDVIGFVPGRLKGCGIAEAVRVKSVSGVVLSQPAVLECSAARALKNWTEKSTKKVLRDTGGGLVGYRVAAHYACRTRNNQPGAPISEHGRGKAIDISGFVLKDGTTLSVLDDWNSRRGRALKRMHKEACGTFGTVLGPRSDRFHRDHFHLDTVRYGGGAYCR